MLRAKVNGLLAVGATYAMILRAIEDENTRLDKRDKLTVDSVRNHSARHFPVQNVAKATYREILERRAQENGVDFVNAVTTAITPMAFYETVMVKGYETLVDSDTKVDVSTGMIAAGRLQALIESRAGGTSMVQIIAQLDRINPPAPWPRACLRCSRREPGHAHPSSPQPDSDGFDSRGLEYSATHPVRSTAERAQDPLEVAAPRTLDGGNRCLALRKRSGHGVALPLSHQDQRGC